MPSEQQPFIPYVEEKDYPANLKPSLEPYVKRMGFLPNALKLYMHRPEIAETLWKLNSNVMRDHSSTLDQGLKRRLAAVASKVNGCAYCAYCSLMYAARSAFGSRSSRFARSSATVMPNRAGDWPGRLRPDCETTQINNTACTASIAARKATTPSAIRQ